MAALPERKQHSDVRTRPLFSTAPKRPAGASGEPSSALPASAVSRTARQGGPNRWEVSVGNRPQVVVRWPDRRRDASSIPGDHGITVARLLSIVAPRIIRYESQSSTMLTYLVRPRGLYREPENASLQFPGTVRLEFHIEPGGPFGEDVPPLRTVPFGAKMRLEWNACRGETSISTDARLPKIAMQLEGQDGRIEVDGALVRIVTDVRSRDELERLLETYFYGLPPLLGLEMLDTPIMSEVRGSLGDVTFCWGLLDSGQGAIDATTSDIQAARITRALSRLQMLDERNGLANRRLLAATQYFHIACRLLQAPGRRWEFLAEAILNFSKTLEVLFPAPPQQSLNVVRQALASSLQFPDLEIEALYIPAIVLRNAVDVAHPTLAAHTTESLAVLAQYCDVADEAFGRLLLRIFDRVADGSFALAVPSSTAVSSDTTRVIERMRNNLQQFRAQNAPRRQRGDKA